MTLENEELRKMRDVYLRKNFGVSGEEGERRQAVYYIYRANNGEIHPIFKKMAEKNLE